MNRLLPILCFLLIFTSTFGQVDTPKKHTYFITKAIDNEDNTIFIPFAHVYNESLKTAAISDTVGIIKIRGNLNDTLVITAVGYYPKVIVLNNEQINTDSISNTVLTRRSYNIKEVSIHALGTYQQFKKKVENLDLPYTREENLRADLKEQSVEEAKKAYEEAKTKKMLATTPLNEVSIATVPILSQQEKQMLKYKEMLKKEERKNVIYAKFNKTVVKNLTALEEPELTDFFVFCNLDEDFLYEVSEYEVREAIKNKYTLFLAMKEKKTKDTVTD